MKQIKVIIERSKDLVCCYSDNVEGLNGCGDTIEEANQSLLKTISL